MKHTSILTIGLAAFTAMGAATLTPTVTSADTSPLGQTSQDQPVISTIQLDGTEVVVLVQVPAGIRKVTLEGRSRLGAGTWSPRAVARLDGNGGEVTFRLPCSADIELLRVRAEANDPLPSSFYRGTNEFLGQTSSSEPLPPGAVYRLGDVAAPGAENGGDTTTREVVESDIWRISGNTLYFFNQYRGLQIIDLTNPDAPALTGTLEMPAVGEQMYVLDNEHVVLLARKGCGWTADGPESEVILVAVNGGEPSVESRLPIAGSLQESRMVGTALYVATSAYRKVVLPPTPDSGTGEQWEWGTKVFAFDLADPANPAAKEALWFAGYDNVITATDRFLFVVTQAPRNWWQSIVQLIDISSPDGTMTWLSSLRTQGRIPDKFKLHVNGHVLTTISENWSERLVTKLETFDLSNPAEPVKLNPGRELDLGRGEQLHATRFDGDRVYVVTFFRIDPLFVVDLSDPANPQIKGEVEIPGWSTFIYPWGDRLVTVGIDNTNGWRVAVQLFDVADATQPGLIGKVLLGENSSWSEANYDEKAFGVLPDAGLILVPYQGDTQNGYASLVQLIDLEKDSLAKRGAIEHRMQPRRATVFDDRVLSLSGSELLAVDITDRDRPVVTADLELAWTADRVLLAGDYLLVLANANSWNGQDTSLHVALADAPDTAVNQVTLDEHPVLGVALREDRLYVAQGIAYLEPIYVTDGDGKQQAVDDTDTPNFFLSVFDVSQLPEVTLLGKTAVHVGQLGWSGNWQPVWAQPELLVWSAGGGYSWWYWDWRGPVRLGGPQFVGLDAAIGFMPYWGGYGGRLVAFDVRDDANPTFKSEVNLGAEHGWWSFSEAFVAAGKVFMSHQASEFLEGVLPPGQAASDQTPKVDPTTGEVIPPPPIGTWVTRYYLDVIDYADPANPTVYEPVEPVTLPGTLQGISHDGNVLYTVGPHYDPVTWQTDWSEWLDALAYSEDAANLVDSLALPKSWPHPVLIRDAKIFLGRPAQDENAGDTLEVWFLNDAGQFSRLAEVPLGPSNPAHSLAAFGNLLVAQAGTDLRLYDKADPAALKLIGQSSPDGCLGYNLGQADGAVDRGLWLPLGSYGVLKIGVTHASPPTP